MTEINKKGTDKPEWPSSVANKDIGVENRLTTEVIKPTSQLVEITIKNWRDEFENHGNSITRM